MICDFCTAVDPAWEYPCQSFRLEQGPVAESIESWLACDKCSELIERDQWDFLAYRSVTHCPTLKALLPEAGLERLVDYALNLQRQFRENRRGPRVERKLEAR